MEAGPGLGSDVGTPGPLQPPAAATGGNWTPHAPLLTPFALLPSTEMLDTPKSMVICASAAASAEQLQRGLSKAYRFHCSPRLLQKPLPSPEQARLDFLTVEGPGTHPQALHQPAAPPAATAVAAVQGFAAPAPVLAAGSGALAGPAPAPHLSPLHNQKQAVTTVADPQPQPDQHRASGSQPNPPARQGVALAGMATPAAAAAAPRAGAGGMRDSAAPLEPILRALQMLGARSQQQVEGQEQPRAPRAPVPAHLRLPTLPAQLLPANRAAFGAPNGSTTRPAGAATITTGRVGGAPAGGGGGALLSPRGPAAAAPVLFTASPVLILPTQQVCLLQAQEQVQSQHRGHQSHPNPRSAAAQAPRTRNSGGASALRRQQQQQRQRQQQQLQLQAQQPPPPQPPQRQQPDAPTVAAAGSAAGAAMAAGGADVGPLFVAAQGRAPFQYVFGSSMQVRQPPPAPPGTVCCPHAARHTRRAHPIACGPPASATLPAYPEFARLPPLGPPSLCVWHPLVCGIPLLQLWSRVPSSPRQPPRPQALQPMLTARSSPRARASSRPPRPASHSHPSRMARGRRLGRIQRETRGLLPRRQGSRTSRRGASLLPLRSDR